MTIETSEQPSGWAVGWTAFAGFILIMIGVFQAIAGIVAMADDELLVITQDWVFSIDTTTWGWIHLILGIIVLLAGFGLFSGTVWARTVGVIFEILSAISAFLWLPYYPVWAVIIIAIDVFVIWARTVHGRDIAME